MEFSSCEIPLFKRHVIAAINCTETEALHYFTTYCKNEADGFFANVQKVDGANGWCQYGGGDIYLWAEDSYAVLFHEIVHAAFKLCQHIEMATDEEMIARLVEYMKVNLVDELKEVDGKDTK